jgi:hypothetical protein
MTSSLSSSEEIGSITSTNLAHQEEEALKIQLSEEGDGLSLTLPTVEDAGGPSLTLSAIEEGVDRASPCWPLRRGVD